MKKRLISLILIVLCFFNISCGSNTNKNTSVKGELGVQQLIFDENISDKIADDYMSYLVNNDFEAMKKISVKNLLTDIDISEAGKFKIISYKLDEISQKGESSVYKYIINIKNINEPKVSLEEVFINVTKEDNDYKVNRVKTNNMLQGFIENDILKLRKFEQVEIKQVIKLAQIPNTMYPKRNTQDIVKFEVPKEKFSDMVFSFDEQSIAISTTNGKDNYICIVTFDEEAINQNHKEDVGKNDDKGVARKIVSIDILDDTKIENMDFSNDNKFLIVNYTNSKDVNRFNVYSEKGDLTTRELDKMFSDENYDIEYKKYQGKEVTFEVKKAKNATNARQSSEGLYKISLENFKITKL